MPADTPARVARSAAAAIHEVDTAALPGFMRQLDHAALLAMARTLGRNGLFRPGVRHRWDQIADRLRVAPRHRWILRRWLTALQDEGLLRRDDTTGFLHDLRAVPRTEAAEATALVDEAARGLGYPPEMARFFRSAIDQLPRLLRDEVSVQALLFPDGDLTTAEGAYKDNVINHYLNTAAVELLRAECRHVRAPLRVLELGAGVGGTTAAVVPALAQESVDYLYTDVSQFFLDAGRQRFGDRLRYGIFDINIPTPAQPGSADVVLAANVLHNSVHIGHALARLRELLSPSGLLVVIESCREHYQAMTSMQFLMSPRDGEPQPGATDVRAGTDRIFLTRDEWLAELIATGFTPLVDLPEPNDPLAALGQHIFAARTDELEQL
ncbi:class I SAM-dependent methyltransferase [Saccharopolyspora sp. WRP15-2]|uniref:Class I SAM-dependent methyltransferase n=1 Tax=Saccharopolyspora oryzae TaxID=2997343 RepID=A0ABT4VA42_9PSEU|nr:class I SAM-dependent methyltransferase [Saccharopolyspora oryzae]MDA3630839.1 class I SAM-dependent methyltransferase [Saccharopolyspora oryzae]